MEFQYPFLFIALSLLPLVLLAWLLVQVWRRKALLRFGEAAVLEKVMPDRSATRQALKFSLFFVAFFFLLTALVNPRFGAKLEKVKKRGADIIVCLDISNSMRARDVKPDRLERARMAVSKMMDRFGDDQIGIVVFAGRAQTQLPLTPDYAAAKLYLENISTDQIAVQGTAIGAALDLATNSFNFKSKTKKVIILISDGENHEDDALRAAEEAAKKGITIFTVGFGSPEGAPIPIADGSTLEYKKDPGGNTVVTKLNEQMLQQIAAIGKGTYTRAVAADAGLNRIYDEIGKMEKAEYEALNFTDYENLFPYLLGLALALLVAEFFIFERKTKLTRNIHLFSKPASDYVIGNKEKS